MAYRRGERAVAAFCDEPLIRAALAVSGILRQSADDVRHSSMAA